jgi:glycine/D-amino acid oxidase-like deaminating enzyme
MIAGKMPEIIIIGGGLQGCSTAVHLAQRGRNVLVLEKNTAGRHASGVNAGGVRRLFRAPEEIPLSIAAQKLWHRIETLVDDDCGFRPTGQVKIAENTADMRKLGKRAERIRSPGAGRFPALRRCTDFKKGWICRTVSHQSGLQGQGDVPGGGYDRELPGHSHRPLE